MKEITLTELYVAIVALTEAVKENTAAKGVTTVTVEAPKEAEKPQKESKAVESEPETEEEAQDGVTLRDVEAALLEVKAAKGASEAQKLLKGITGSTSVKKSEPAQYQTIIDACEAALSGDDSEPEQVETETKAEIGDRNEMEALIAELAQSELGGGKPENFETAKMLIKTVGKADKKANIADENIQPMIDALQKAIAALSGDDEADDSL